MTPVHDLMVQHGVAVLLAWAFIVQAGVPAPAVPMLLGAGALSGSGQMDLVLAVAAAMAATLGADVIWYSLGRTHGTRVLGVLCRFSQDPDFLIRHAKERFAVHRGRYLIVAKFLPGANPLAAGLAGAVPVRPASFLLHAAFGALLWAGAWITLGYIYADAIALVATRRRRFLRHLRKARISPTELKRRMEAGNHFVVVDLRTALDIEKASYGIPGARWIPPEALDDPHELISKGSEVVFYCAEPREATSARMALLLSTHGYKDLHPLSGGIEGWREAGFAVEPLPVKRTG